MSSPAERYAAAQRRSAEQRIAAHLDDFAQGYEFGLDEFQRQSCIALSGGQAVLVAAPTGAGKTVVGEYAVYLALKEGVKCFYTTPIKALSNQKFHDLRDRYGADVVGLLTGDNSINGEAPIVVMTTEVLRNMLYAESSTLDDLGYVVMDEVHYLADRFRGAVWEEVIIQLPARVRLVALSATVSNAEEFGDWIATVRGDTEVIVDEIRPVPLWQQVMVGTKLYDLFVDDDQTVVNPHLVRIARESDRQEKGGHPSSRYRRKDRNTPWRSDVVATLDQAGLLPGITFIFSRAGCDAAVQQCIAANLTLTTSAEREEIRRIVESRTLDLPHEDLSVLRYDEWVEGLMRGLAAHHAGLIPRFKEVVEELFQQGLIRMVFATETLALGINMPARTVVLERLVKYNGEAHVDITPGEYTQLTGRAGRRGIDVEGHAVVAWHRELNPSNLAGLASTRTYPLRSSFRPSYTMAVGLVRRLGRNAARDLLETSFAQFQADRSVVGLAATIRRETTELGKYRDSMECHLGDFDEYSRLRRELTDSEKAAGRASATRRRQSVEDSLRLLRVGDVIDVDSGRRRMPAVIVDVGAEPEGQPIRLQAVTIDRRAKRLSGHDFTHPVAVTGRIRVPKGFSLRSTHARKDLASILKGLSRDSQPSGKTKGKAQGKRESHEEAEISSLRARIRQHPCHGCSDRETHARWAERYLRAERQIASLEKQVKERTHTVSRQFDRVCDVLLDLGYFTGSGDSLEVTSPGNLLAGLYTERDLLVAEALRQGLWQELDAPALAAICSGMLYESRQREDAPYLPTGAIQDAISATEELWHDLHAVERTHGLSFMREPDWGFAHAIHRWCLGARLKTVLHDADLSAGDFVRWAKQVIDVLGQIADASTTIHDERTMQTAREAADLIDRGIVRYSSLP
jgi:ATP-dependent RNA helicase HelY